MKFAQNRHFYKVSTAQIQLIPIPIPISIPCSHIPNVVVAFDVKRKCLHIGLNENANRAGWALSRFRNHPGHQSKLMSKDAAVLPLLHIIKFPFHHETAVFFNGPSRYCSCYQIHPHPFWGFPPFFFFWVLFSPFFFFFSFCILQLWVVTIFVV